MDRGDPEKRRPRRFRRSEYGSPPPRADRSPLTVLTRPREFLRATLELLEGLAQDPFVIAGAATGVVAGGLALWLSGMLLVGVIVLIVTFVAVVLMQMFF